MGSLSVKRCHSIREKGESFDWLPANPAMRMVTAGTRPTMSVPTLTDLPSLGLVQFAPAAGVADSEHANGAVRTLFANHE